MLTRTLKMVIPCALVLAVPMQRAHAAPQDTANKQDGSAQTLPPSTSAPYLLGAEDVIAITVNNVPDISGQVIVSPDGTIKLPGVLKEVYSVTGKTTTEVEDMLTQKLAKYVVNPFVSVRLIEKRKQNVLIYGSVLRAGPLDYRRTLKAGDALAEAGGGNLVADLTQVVLTHVNGQKQILDLSHPEHAGPDAQIPLVPDDTLYVPERKTVINVTGEVNRPGNFDWTEKLTVMDAITQAGGYKADSADLANATLTHANGTEEPLNLDNYIRHGDLNVNVKLKPGDKIMIPEMHNRIYVFGAVGALAGSGYTYSSGDRVIDAIKGVGGPNSSADLSKVSVIRQDKSDKSTAKVYTVNMDKFLKKGDAKGNILLEPGDVVYIPDKKKRMSTQDFMSTLTGVGWILNIARLIL